jgi:hypothetical protein
MPIFAHIVDVSNQIQRIFVMIYIHYLLLGEDPLKHKSTICLQCQSEYQNNLKFRKKEEIIKFRKYKRPLERVINKYNLSSNHTY